MPNEVYEMTHTALSALVSQRAATRVLDVALHAGGTDADDIIISGIGDDTIYGDGGNDKLEGGFGNDIINGGDGDDIITDTHAKAQSVTVRLRP